MGGLGWGTYVSFGRMLLVWSVWVRDAGGRVKLQTLGYAKISLHFSSCMYASPHAAHHAHPRAHAHAQILTWGATQCPPSPLPPNYRSVTNYVALQSTNPKSSTNSSVAHPDLLTGFPCCFDLWRRVQCLLCQGVDIYVTSIRIPP